MSNEQITPEPVSEVAVDTGAVVETQPVRQVPLEALEAERHKRQELEARNRLLEMQFMQQQQAAAETQPEDGHDLVNRAELRSATAAERAALKREIAEEMYKEANPDAVKAIESHLKEILEREPWLAKGINEASNRYLAAYKVVKSFGATNAGADKQAPSKSAQNDAQRIVDNAKKPGSPVAIAKSANLSQADFLKSVAGKKEFNEYRKQLLGR